MEITFDKKKREYIDNEIMEILDLVEEADSDAFKKSGISKDGSIAQKIPIDLTGKLVDSPIIISKNDYHGVIAKKECYSGKCIGLNEENYIRLIKLTKTICQEKSIKNVASKEFVENKAFKWLVETFKAKKVEILFSNFILDKIQEAIKSYKFYFPILYLEIGRFFQIGHASFDFFTKDYFDSLVEFHRKTEGYQSADTFESLRNKYQGKVFVSCVIKAERNKAEEIAFNHCSLAVDVLKMCSETTDFPFIELGFDIDSRVRVNSQAEILVSEADNELKGFSISLTRPKHQHKIYEQEWERILQLNMQGFHKFLLSLTEDSSELEKLIINSIKRFGNAISNRNLHQRIVELFTILESLLLLDKNTPIIDSVCKYCSKLVFKKVEDRKSLIELLKKMYDVRSNLIHHGKESDFEMESLRKLQYTVIMLLLVLVTKTKQHQIKQSLLNEIDDAILGAY